MNMTRFESERGGSEYIDRYAGEKQTFADAVESIMPLVREESEKPFIIHRKQENGTVTGEWTVDFPENAYLYLSEVRKYDPYANVHTGRKFACDNFQFVHGKILLQRLVAENIAQPDSADLIAFHAVFRFMEEHFGDFSAQAVKWLTDIEKPLERVTEEMKNTCTLIGGTIARPNRAIEVIENCSLADYAEQNAAKPKTYEQIQRECAFDEVISGLRIPGEMAVTSYVNCQAAYEILCEKFGAQCTNEVLAAIVSRSDYDGRYDRKNKEWANTLDPERLEQAKNNIRSRTVNTHPTILNDLAGKARENAEKTAKTNDKATKTPKPRKPKKRDDDAR